MRVTLLLLSWAWVTQGQFKNEQILGPADPSKFEDWFQTIAEYKKRVWSEQHYNGSVYEIPELEWTQTAYIQPQMHPFDRYFYDPDANTYTVQSWLDDLIDRYGGIDSALVWPTYPNIGVDNRNQYDLIRSLPGGPNALKNITDQLHSAGVKVLWPFNPWDQYTRDVGTADPKELADLIISSNGDGFNGDTMGSIPEEFFLASKQRGKSLGLEPEGGGTEDTINWDTMGWGYWDYPFIPSVDRFKWLDPRRMTNVCDRWAKDHTDNLQFAYFNGDGFESWENVWGTWNGMTPRDGEATRRVGSILRYFGSHRFLQSQEWIPHTPVLQHGVFASKFPNNNEVVWLFVNRNTRTNTSGPQIDVSLDHEQWKWYDCYHGEELHPTPKGSDHVTLSFDIEASGFGCLFATANSSSDLEVFLEKMKHMTSNSLAYFSHQWQYLEQQSVYVEPTTRTMEPPTSGGDMVDIPANPSFLFQVSGVEIEGDDMHGVDVQYPWEPHPTREHSHIVNIGRFFIDKYPVTNERFAAFLKASSYEPKDPHNFLKDWVNGSYPNGWHNKPVTWISLNEARAYCRFYGKRLPREYEWQYAAQGPSQRLYPWGNNKNTSNFPTPDDGRTMRGPDDVTAHSPVGDSVFGVSDLVGNVWQYTDEYMDDHTRYVVVRGSGYYRPKGSHWYFPNALELNLHNKYLLMSDSSLVIFRYERSGGIGFRCAADAVPKCSSSACAHPVTVPRDVNLTEIGLQGWVHWGSTVEHQRKSKLNFTGLSTLKSSGKLQEFDNLDASFSWNDGFPSPSANNVSTGTGMLASNAVENGIEFTVTGMDTSTPTTIIVYVGASEGAGNFSLISQGKLLLNDTTFVAFSTLRLVAYYVEYTGPSVKVTWSINAAILHAPPGFVQLSNEGVYDWVHYGSLIDPLAGNRKGPDTHEPLIQHYNLIGTTEVQTYDNNPVAFGWSDGFPTQNESSTTSGVFAAGSGSGFSFTSLLPSSDSCYTVRVYVGVYRARGRFQAFVDGSTTPMYSDNSLVATTGTSNGMYVIPICNSAEVLVTWTQESEDSDGNVTFQAATIGDKLESKSRVFAVAAVAQ